MLPGAWLCQYLLPSLLAVLLRRDPDVEFLGHTVILCLTFQGTAILLPRLCLYFQTIYFSPVETCYNSDLRSYKFLPRALLQMRVLRLTLMGPPASSAGPARTSEEEALQGSVPWKGRIRVKTTPYALQMARNFALQLSPDLLLHR